MLRSLLRCAAGATIPRCIQLFLLVILVGTAICVDEVAAGSNDRNVLVLTNGRVISGRVSQGAGGFMVKTESGGSILVPFDRIRFHASDMHDAYLRFLESFPNPSPDTHVALAGWCLTQQLYDETKIELRAALKANPNHTEARNMLRRLEVILKPQSSPQETTTKAQSQTGDGFETPPASSLAGLSREAALEFVTKVQPLMMNSCAQAGCHSVGSRNAFQLERVRLGPRSSRVLTQRNLAATLQYINRSDADGSRMLTVPLGSHGRGGRPIFSRSRGTGQFKLLRNWVRRIAAESPAEKRAAKSSERRGDNFAGSRTARGNFTLQRGQQPRSTLDRNDTLRGESPKSITNARPSADRARVTTGGDALLEAIVREQRRDAFDPAEFNRKSKTAVPR
ncbi:MAG: hypothetical protein HON53_14100 [Planctomycetaceae bacterium]|nr:hypothetical protein [Planctomycetaceae bacterium]MBT6157280.1 hypothetical protein [Planctomycetaceae bacterium]MBT6493317.1 hypothetical protein [Planctomycetaceae bacterium]